MIISTHFPSEETRHPVLMCIVFTVLVVRHGKWTTLFSVFRQGHYDHWLQSLSPTCFMNDSNKNRVKKPINHSMTFPTPNKHTVVDIITITSGWVIKLPITAQPRELLMTSTINREHQTGPLNERWVLLTRIYSIPHQTGRSLGS